MTIFELLLGILLAAGLFASTLWSGYSVFAARSRDLKRLHAAQVICLIAGMGTVSAAMSGLAQVVALPLSVLACLTLLRDTGWSRILNLAPLGLAVVLIAGLPFGPA